MDRFVCVRIVQGWGLDLTLFQYDWRQTWQVFLMNADRDIYGRYSAHHSDDLEALRKAMEGALELHARYPANKGELAGKRGIPLPWKRPEEMPALQARGMPRPVTGRDGCIHCHNIQEGATKSYAALGQPVPARISAPYPTTQRVGFMLDTAERATVADVQTGTPAAASGMKVGDRLLRLGGQPILSAADAQWVLWSGPDAGILKAQVDRGGRTMELEMSLPEGWRSK
ncbi:MAG TPA: PDZ domain-containing protein [Planctomycetota bacterium]|nr:PDZ domain-containing protein [Planctomycetota bacterium]